MQRSDGDWKIKILPHCTAAVARLILECTDADAARRPPFSALQKQLRAAEASQKLQPFEPGAAGGAGAAPGVVAPAALMSASSSSSAAAGGGSSYISAYCTSTAAGSGGGSTTGGSADAEEGSSAAAGRSVLFFCQATAISGRKEVSCEAPQL